MKRKQTYRSSFAQTLLLSVLSLFFFFFLCMISYQYKREREYKVSLMNQKLQDYNQLIIETLTRELPVRIQTPSPQLENLLDLFLEEHPISQLRITIISLSGKVLYDSKKKDYSELEDHRARPEIRKALKDGTGYNVRRYSGTMQKDFFYVATLKPDKYVVRSALPYGVALSNSLAVDYGFIVFAVLLLFVLAVIFYIIIRKIDVSITSLREFALKVDRNDPIDEEEEVRFPKNELGDISQHLIRIYKRMIHTKEELLDGREKLLEQKAIQVQQRRELTQNVAHELKTPVASIQGYLETIVSNPEITSEKRELFLEKCYAQSNRLARLLKDISLLNRMDDASDMLEMEAFDIQVMVNTILNELSLQLEERHITVFNELNTPIPMKGNMSLIYSIFRNLMDNAIAYAGEHIHITITLKNNKEGYYEFSFSDDGAGVDSKHLERIFERFYRVDKGRSRKLGGTGLGLAIVKNAILLHAGTIKAIPVYPHGLCFNFTLSKNL